MADGQFVLGDIVWAAKRALHDVVGKQIADASATLTAVACLHSSESAKSPPHDVVGLCVYCLGFSLSRDESKC